MKKILIACEESQSVCKEFRNMGFQAWSCDLKECSGGYPEYHIKGDVIHLLNDHWDLIIAHPPCTYLTVTGNRWFDIEKYGAKAIQRYKEREEAVNFFMKFVNAECKHVAIENPVGVMSTIYRKPDQIIQPYMFGDPFEKRTCLWLKGLKPLKPTEVVKPEERIYFKSGKSMPKWYAESYKLKKEERSRIRSKTFRGIAVAMAQQWGVQI